jgi:hypothetical protein
VTAGRIAEVLFKKRPHGLYYLGSVRSGCVVVEINRFVHGASKKIFISKNCTVAA